MKPSDGAKDALVAFGILSGLFSLWQAIEIGRERQQGRQSIANRLDRIEQILARLEKGQG